MINFLKGRKLTVLVTAAVTAVVAGGVGVAGPPADRAEFAALVGAAGTRTSTNLTAAINFPSPLPTPGAIYIDGIRLPFYGACGTDIACIDAASRGRPSGSSPGSFAPGGYVFPPGIFGRQAPEGYLSPVFPLGSASPGGLKSDDVRQTVNQAIAQATAAIQQQALVQCGEAGGVRQRHQVVTPNQPDQSERQPLATVFGVGQRAWRALFWPAPWEQGVDLADWVISDAVEDIGQIGLRIDAAHLRGFDDGVDGSCALATGV